MVFDIRDAGCGEEKRGARRARGGQASRGARSRSRMELGKHEGMLGLMRLAGARGARGEHKWSLSSMRDLVNLLVSNQPPPCVAYAPALRAVAAGTAVSAPCFVCVGLVFVLARSASWRRLA